MWGPMQELIETRSARNEYIVEVTCCSLHKVEDGQAEACRLRVGDLARHAAACEPGVAVSMHVASPPSPALRGLEEVVSAAADRVEPF
mmetsp:Transcript_95697/g.189693  ORF Transcript_95697/g.189693 Transcript_95697/m.189693 type:complete len:88 (-) Transcript_95697:844-1107(-)